MGLWFSRTPSVGIAELEAAVGAGGRVQIVDVREQHEYRAGHLPGARPIPLGSLGRRLGELDAAAPTYVICETGSRSAAAARALARAGFGEVYNVRGGTAAWRAAGRRLVRGERTG